MSTSTTESISQYLANVVPILFSAHQKDLPLVVSRTFSALLGNPSQLGVWRSVRDSTHCKNWSRRIPSGMVMFWFSLPAREHLIIVLYHSVNVSLGVWLVGRERESKGRSDIISESGSKTVCGGMEGSVKVDVGEVKFGRVFLHLDHFSVNLLKPQGLWNAGP